jgi:ABC-type arginine transport system permease subunit
MNELAWSLQNHPAFWPFMFLIVCFLFLALAVVSLEPVEQATRRYARAIKTYFKRRKKQHDR